MQDSWRIRLLFATSLSPYIWPRNMRTAASESAIGELQIPLRAAAPIKLPTFWTNGETQEECSSKPGWYNPYREELMLNLSKVVRQLRNEREQTQAKLDQLNTALKVLGEVGTAGSRTVGRRRHRESGDPCQLPPRRGLLPPSVRVGRNGERRKRTNE